MSEPKLLPFTFVKNCKEPCISFCFSCRSPVLHILSQNFPCPTWLSGSSMFKMIYRLILQQGLALGSSGLGAVGKWLWILLLFIVGSRWCCSTGLRFGKLWQCQPAALYNASISRWNIRAVKRPFPNSKHELLSVQGLFQTWTSFSPVDLFPFLLEMALLLLYFLGLCGVCDTHQRPEVNCNHSISFISNLFL